MRYFRWIGFAALALVFAASSPAQQKPMTREQQKVVNTVKSIFVAAKTDDFAKFNSIVVPGYYMFDGGRRFNGEAIMKIIGEDHAKGVRYDWNVTDPDVHVSGHSAWIAYENRGSVTDPQGNETKMTWLESAILEKRNGAWRIVFFQSTRVPAAVKP